MGLLETAVDSLARNKGFLTSTVADFSDAEMLKRPCPGGNHAAWQIGHLIGAEARMVNAASPGAAPMPPASFTDKFKKDTASIDDASFFPSKNELLETFGKQRDATIAWASKLSEADLAKPMPEPINRFAPTVGHLILGMPVHVAMHVGQFQAIRRALGKPVLF